jgi:hypothetical protein
MKPTPWTHHALTLWSSEPDGRPDAQSKAATFGRQATAATKRALAINRVNSMADRVETVLCQSNPDFFARQAGLSKARATVLDAVAESPRLRWILVTDCPENVARVLPDCLAACGNVCIAVRMTPEVDWEGVAERIASFR